MSAASVDAKHRLGTQEQDQGAVLQEPSILSHCGRIAGNPERPLTGGGQPLKRCRGGRGSRLAAVQLKVMSWPWGPGSLYRTIFRKPDLPSALPLVPQSLREDAYAETHVDIQGAFSFAGIRMEIFSTGLSASEGSCS